jgi:3-phosphoshikimate 1-carboxyvinyltransferase
MSAFNFVSHPVASVSGEINVPGDKSISHRAIMLGAISNGITHVDGFLDGDDCLATIAAFRAMGVQIDGPHAQSVTIHGVGKHGLRKPSKQMDCGNSGTSMRLLTGILAAQSFDSQLTGDASLLNRPMNRVARPLMQMGAQINTAAGRPPLKIRGGQSLQGITYTMPQASAQVKSCLLLAGLYAEGSTTVIEPEVTRDHTERMLAALGYSLQRSGNAITIDSQHTLNGTSIQVPGDISSAAFFMVAATITPGSYLKIRDVGINPTRTGVIDILTQMGANIHLEKQRQYGGEPAADIVVRYAPLKGIEIPTHLVPLAIDEFPIIFIAAACAQGKTILRGAEELRCKESDRISAMAKGLQQLGVEAIPTEDGMVIQGGTIGGGVVDSLHDHRIAMAFSIAGAVATAPITIQDCRNVTTSFPGFVDIANMVRLNICRTDA